MKVPEHVTPLASQLRARPLGPDSIIWRYFGDSRFLLFFAQGLTMQVAHPVIGQGVADHSTFKTDPFGRYQRSLALLWPVVYNTPEGALEYGAKLREMHRAIKGTLPDGTPYAAFNVEPYLWVHMGVFDAVLRLAGFAGSPLTPAGELQLFAEWRQMGLLLGLREQDMPADIPAFWQRFEDIIKNRLGRNETLDYLMRKGYYLRVAKPPLSWLPDILWKQIHLPIGNLGWLVTRATFPPSFRERFQIPWSHKDERDFNRLLKVLRAAWLVMPEKLRYLPEAHVAVVDARRHPERYRLPAQAVTA